MTRADIRTVKARNQAALLALPGVVSVGIGLNLAGEEAIVIGLDGRRRDSENQLPEQLEGYPVDVQIIGPLRAQ